MKKFGIISWCNFLFWSGLRSLFEKLRQGWSLQFWWTIQIRKQLWKFSSKFGGLFKLKNFEIQKSRFFKFFEKVFSSVDDWRVLHLEKTRYVHRRNFDKLLKYINSLGSFHLSLKSEQLFQNFEHENSRCKSYNSRDCPTTSGIRGSSSKFKFEGNGAQNGSLTYNYYTTKYNVKHTSARKSEL